MCKEEFIETKKGVCESCKKIYPGCKSCFYVQNQKGFDERNRSIVCDSCESGYFNTNGKCESCKEKVRNCEKCEKNEKNVYVCIKCEKGFVLSENGNCNLCEGIIKNDKCVKCEFEIEGCETCSIKNDVVECDECKKGFIYDEKEKSCLNLFQNENLQKLINCKQINSTLNYKCTKCIEGFVLLLENNISTCVSVDFIYSFNNERNSNCEFFVNEGTLEQPKFMCEKCLNDFTKIYYKNYETFFCENSNKYEILNNCEEANFELINNEIKINCTKCAKNYKEIFDSERNSFFCKFLNTILTFDEIKNQTSNNLTFNFILKGKLNRELKPSIKNINLFLAEIEGKFAECKMTIKENKEANLDCFLDIKDYKEYKTFSFKKDLIDFEEFSIFLNFDEMVLINNYKNDEKINVEIYDENNSESNDENENENENDSKEKNDNNKKFILICVFYGTIFIIVVIIIVVIIIKIKKMKNVYNYVNNNVETKNEKSENENENVSVKIN